MGDMASSMFPIDPIPMPPILAILLSGSSAVPKQNTTRVEMIGEQRTRGDDAREIPEGVE